MNEPSLVIMKVVVRGDLPLVEVVVKVLLPELSIVKAALWAVVRMTVGVPEERQKPKHASLGVKRAA